MRGAETRRNAAQQKNIMEIQLFILISIGLIILPGPNVLVIVSTTLSDGRRRGLQTVAGASTAMLIQLATAAFGATWFVAGLASGFIWLKWAGVAYLFYLGVTQLVRSTSTKEAPSATALGSFQRGFWVSLTNPKTILFFSAFLPQFVSPTEPFLAQITLLSVTFWGLALILDSGYALLAGQLAYILSSRKLSKLQNRFSGLLYLGAGTVLAATRHGE